MYVDLYSTHGEYGFFGKTDWIEDEKAKFKHHLMHKPPRHAA
jgi:hypothetical protein